mgnify:CR=1 FL=1
MTTRMILNDLLNLFYPRLCLLCQITANPSGTLPPCTFKCIHGNDSAAQFITYNDLIRLLCQSLPQLLFYIFLRFHTVFHPFMKLWNYGSFSSGFLLLLPKTFCKFLFSLISPTDHKYHIKTYLLYCKITTYAMASSQIC